MGLLGKPTILGNPPICFFVSEVLGVEPPPKKSDAKKRPYLFYIQPGWWHSTGMVADVEGLKSY